MALHISSFSHQSWSPATPITGTRSLPRIELWWNNSKSSCYNGVVESKMISEKVQVKCASLENENLVGNVTEVSKDTFWPIVHASQDKTLVLDLYTQWCGPCKLMAPKFAELAQEYEDVIFLKLDCASNQENKALARELGIRVVPTFKILRDSKVVKEVTGAKIEELVKAIDAVSS